MTTNSARLERLRRARSLNDVVAIGKEVGRDITRVRNISKVLGIESTSAGIKFSHDKMSGTKSAPSKINVKSVSPSKMGAELSSFKSPPMTQVMQHSAVIHSLQENLYELEAAAAMVRTTFNRSKNQSAAVKGIEALVKEARASLESAYSSLQYIARKHLPKEMAALGEELRTFLIDNLDRMHYLNLSTHVYVTAGEATKSGKLPHQQFGIKKVTKLDLKNLPKTAKKETGTPTKEELKQDIVFAFYLDIENLKDSSGATLAHYYVILTGVIGMSGKIRYFLTGLPEFQPPGVYSPGSEIESPEQMIARLRLLLSTNDIMSTIEKKPMPINTADAARKGFNKIANVEQVYVADDSMWVVVEPGYKGTALDKVVDKIVNQVFPLLNKAVGNTRRTKSAIKYKTVTRKGKHIIQFFLTSTKRPEGGETFQVNAEQLADLKESLGIPNHVLDDIKKVLRRHA